MFNKEQVGNNEVNPASDLSFPLIKFSSDPQDWWRVENAVEGVQIFGGIGSGKTSGSGRTVAESFLRNGFGGIVLCAKPDEADTWELYAKECGRPESDIIRFCEGSKYRFNPLQYEANRKGRGANLTTNITDLFITVFKMGQRISGSDAEEKDQFWLSALKRCMNRLIDLLKLAKEEVSVANMVKLISKAPTSLETMEKIHSFPNKKILEWAKTDYFIYCLNAAADNKETAKESYVFSLLKNYFLIDFATLDSKVRSSIKETFLGYCEPFMNGILYDHFSTDTNILPEETFEGKIIILDFPIKEYLASGIYAQTIFKHLWQQAVERRPVNKTTVPVFIWIDESQYFVNEFDTIFQTTARSSKACTVMLTQNISNYYAHMGGKEIEPKVNSLLGNLSTKIFHCNNDTVTNNLASEIIGKYFLAIESGSNSKAIYSLESIKGESYSMQLLPQVLPLEFTKLLTGGKTNNYNVQAIIAVKSRVWSTGRNYKRIYFEQKPI